MTQRQPSPAHISAADVSASQAVEVEDGFVSADSAKPDSGFPQAKPQDSKPKPVLIEQAPEPEQGEAGFLPEPVFVEEELPADFWDSPAVASNVKVKHQTLEPVVQGDRQAPLPGTLSQADDVSQIGPDNSSAEELVVGESEQLLWKIQRLFPGKILRIETPEEALEDLEGSVQEAIEEPFGDT